MSEKSHSPEPGSQIRITAFVQLFSPTTALNLRAMAGLFIILLILRLDSFLSLTTNILGGAERDAGLYVWLLKSNTRDLFSLRWFNTHAFYPYTRTLAWSDNFILPSLLAWPFLKFGCPLVLVYNCLLLIAQFLNGYLTYRFCFSLSGVFIPAFIAGAGFMSASYLSATLGHPQLQFIFFLPWALLWFMRYLVTPKFTPALILGLIVSATFLTTVYYSIFLVVTLLVALCAVMLLRPSKFNWRQIGVLVCGGACGMLPLLPFILPYFQVRETFGERALYEAYYFSATFISYFSAAPFNLLYAKTANWTHAEANLFCGIIVLFGTLLSFTRLAQSKTLLRLSLRFLVLFIGAAMFSVLETPNAKLLSAFLQWASFIALIHLLYVLGRLELKLGFTVMTNRGLIAIFTFTAFVLYSISLGPLGNPAKGELALGIFRLFYELVPGLNSIRAISRIGIFCNFALFVLFSLWLAQLVRNNRVGAKSLATCLVLILLENFHYKYPLEQPIPPPTIFEEATKIISAQHSLMVLPFSGELDQRGQVKSWGEFAKLNVNAMLWSSSTERNIVNGYSGQKSKIMREWPGLLDGFPDLRALQTLRHVAGLSYVIYCSSLVPHFERNKFLEDIKSLGSKIALVSEDNLGNFLLELKTESLVDENFYLLAPSYPGGTLSFELQAMFEPGEPEVKVDVLVPRHVPGSPIGEALLKANGKWNLYSFQLPETSDTVRPLKITFSTKGNSQVFIRASSYSSNLK